ncbi:unnamed protein product, partial [Rotaria magnacalcarata]
MPTKLRWNNEHCSAD